MALTEIGARLNLANRRQFQRDAQDSRRDVRGLGDEVERTGTRAKSTGDRLRSFGRNAALGFGVAAAGIGAFAGAGLQALIGMEKLEAQTQAAITSTGGAANVTAKQVQEMAGAIERTTGVEAESVVAGQNMLLTFGQIRNRAGENNDIFNQATKALVDMSVATGVDASKAAVGLGKALNDPVKGLTALSKQGVGFTKQQQDQVKAMMAVGDIAGAQKVILDELAFNYGGSAEAFGQTTAGKIERAKAAVGDLQESVATLLLPALTKLTDWATTTGLPALDRLGAWFTGPGGEGVRDFAGDALEVAKTVGGLLADGFDLAHRNADILVPTVAALTAGFVAFKVVTGVINLAVMASRFLQVAKAVGVWRAVQLHLNIALLANPIGLVVVAVAALVAAIVIAYQRSETFRDIVHGAFDLIKRGAGNAVGFMIQGFRSLLTVWLTVADGIVSGAATALGWVPGIGDKLKAANAAFDTMKDGILSSLDAAADKAYGFGEQSARNLAAGWRDNQPTLQYTVATRIAKDAALEGRATGGPVQAGRPYIVGEHRPELFIPDVRGMILPRVPQANALGTAPRLAAPTIADAAVVGSDGAALPPMTLVVELDSEVLAHTTLRQFEGPLRVRLADAAADGELARQARQ